jgi:flagellar motor protein MotB
MRQRVLALAVMFAVATSMIGCASMNHVEKGMALGAGLGAAIGGIWGAEGGGDLSAGEGLLVGAAAGATVGALVGDQMDRKTNAELEKTIADKDAQIKALQEENRNLSRQLADANQQIANLKRQIADLEKQVADLKAELATRGAPRREITLLSDVLFNPGSDVLSDAGKKALDDAATKLKAEPAGSFVQIEGHTDSDPIKVSSWKSNWELGAGRSLIVLHYLISKGVAPASLSAATFSEYQPVAPNTTADGKSKNRRSIIAIYSNWPYPKK